jgi:hypothetical protein
MLQIGSIWARSGERRAWMLHLAIRDGHVLCFLLR